MKKDNIGKKTVRTIEQGILALFLTALAGAITFYVLVFPYLSLFAGLCKYEEMPIHPAALLSFLIQGVIVIVAIVVGFSLLHTWAWDINGKNKKPANLANNTPKEIVEGAEHGSPQ